MKLSYRQRLFLYFGVLFALFSIGVAVLEHYREKEFKTQALEEKLEAYTEVIDAKIAEHDHMAMTLKELEVLLPKNLRITLIDFRGNVLYDNSIDDFSHLSNHSKRPEIVMAKKNKKGTTIRKSDSNQHPYLYFAKKSTNLYIRVALPYDLHLQNFLKANNGFLYYILLFFLLVLFIIHKITTQFGSTVQKLRDFALQPDKSSTNFQFPNDELGEIGKQITNNYMALEESKKSVVLEKQKLLKHIQISEEGICFVSASNQIELYNGLFIQLLNLIVDNSASEAHAIFTAEVFRPAIDFINTKSDNYFELTIKKHGKIVSLRIFIFEDNSYEIILNDITQKEKTRQLKQEMTGNIAHELRTPIAGIRAYLETILTQEIPEEKKAHFVQQAYNQSVALSDLIKDMSFLSKIEEAPQAFELETVDMHTLLEKLKAEEQQQLTIKNCTFTWDLPTPFKLRGNYTLIHAIFRNLLENALRYAGENCSIHTTLLKEDAKFYYFSFYDTGVGIQDENHLNRIFERFYRVHEGRTRDTGGTGLGLSIVKNAILVHKGSILVKNRKEGGLEFVFQVMKF